MATGLRILTLATAVGCGLVGGVFVAFSSFVMPGLKRLPPAQGIAAMQSINITAVTPVFMTLLFGTAALCAATVVAGIVTRAQGRSAALLIGGGALYLLAAIVLTAAYNVPLNDKLATLDPDSAGAAQQWADYLSGWVTANHVRALGSMGGAILLTLALLA
jgi:uncharacterized membrane protein